MKPIRRILIVDDEIHARDRIARFLDELSFDGEVVQVENGLEAIDQIRSSDFDLVYLDIQMPGLTGFDVLQQFDKRNFVVIFQTAFDEFAMQAFDTNACDYLLKPFSKDRFEKAFIKASKTVETSQKLNDLETSLHRQSQYLANLAVKQKGKTKIVNLSRVDCFVSEDHYTIIHSDGTELVSDLSLAWLEQRIDPKKFVRCHRNNIVAVSQIKSVGDTQNSEVELQSGLKLPLSRNNRKGVLELFSYHSIGSDSLTSSR
jgi:two-component system LytT family response regulator